MESKKSGTGMRCSVKFCNNRACDKKRSFFRYPIKEPERCKVWMKNCQTEHLAEQLVDSHKVCADHFEKKMFLNASVKNRLVFNAVPTVFNDDIINQRKQHNESIKLEPIDPDVSIASDESCGQMVKEEPKDDEYILIPIPETSTSIGIMAYDYQSLPATTSDASDQKTETLPVSTLDEEELTTKIATLNEEKKNLEQTIVRLNQQLANIDSVDNYLKLSEKYLSPELFNIVKYYVMFKHKN
ncbi:THAP domain-containing protein 1-like [Adelges cooleyi]|uniref:THAP domain-containing protein 1-like n=1 Tax=Adelges cooleyi TaxID=133065 RepID=UPI00217FC88B|nr:THAP domain-containing protein 1-like [Adelges cooleyi]